ncbi:acyl-CoA thioesterase [Legionella spiritensis]|uniref:Thiesterase n=1 Tax=Legionella spiritensis TaxID=452 RepID=A0A0W0ZAV7_LEGSP|nr:thioesterase family protein [Legionella spiritensis]KTD66279.1 Thiesterase [Legionella spiritensis]SNV48446.1 Thiesterase [Legionella spiritensis]VEG91490.1 Thiesterase [Legionella spiritensis]
MTEKKITIHQKTFAIEWGDMDALGHVNNTRYFDYFQQARIEWLENLHLDMKQPAGPVVIHVGCTFLKPVVYPATLTIKSSAHSLGRSSFIIDYDLYQSEQLVAQGTSKIVWVDYRKNQSVPVPDTIRKLFE